MLLTKKVKKTEEQQVELKTPYFAKADYYKMFMLCDDGSIIEIHDRLISKWEKQSLTSSHAERIAEILAGEEIQEAEFITAYDKVLRQFENSMFPEAMKINE